MSYVILTNLEIPSPNFAAPCSPKLFELFEINLSHNMDIYFFMILFSDKNTL